MGENKMTLTYLTELANGAYKENRKAVPTAESVRPKVEATVKAMAARGFQFEKATLSAVVAYCQGYSILLSGCVGTGKTMFFRCLNPDIAILDMGDLVHWERSDLETLLVDMREREIVIDDLGSGAATANDYGNRYDVLLYILNKRQGVKARTHFTTNLNSDELNKFYDYRAMDRVYGMAKPYVLERKDSLRKACVR